MMGSQPSTPAANDGFSLLEMMVALAILALLIAVAAPNLAPFRNANLAESVAQELAGVFARARLGALSTGTVQRVEIDLKARTVSDQRGLTESIPDGITTVLRVGRELVEQQKVTVAFLPDGASTGVDILLRDDRGEAVLVRVSWLTGLVSVSGPS